LAVESLAVSYAADPVVFIEYDVDNLAFKARNTRWWSAYDGPVPVALPEVMVDSGQQISYGEVEFATVYGGMVDVSLTRPALAEISATAARVEDTLHFDISLTNHAGVTLSESNFATVWAIVYEQFSTPGGAGLGRLTRRVVQTFAYEQFSTSLADGQTGFYSLDTGALSGVVWDNLHAIVLVDYRATGDTEPYDTLQAVLVEIDQ
jgi:hypothetical protein